MDTDTILQFITYLILYSFAGWVLESVSKTIEQKKFVNSGFLSGPFCPIYGFGALIMLLRVKLFKRKTSLAIFCCFLLIIFMGVLCWFFLRNGLQNKILGLLALKI